MIFMRIYWCKLRLTFYETYDNIFIEYKPRRLNIDLWKFKFTIQTAHEGY